MKLLRLILKGFKSFADPTTIEFSEGVTVIVGPNGCGKSNISDAVRWVLGEQNVRNLRAEKAEELIFSGSETRKARNGAEVTLVLDNSHGELPLPLAEVAITRRILRSGDSDYQIGKRSCRLKDIQELLAPTGLGKGTLAIIGQNRVDQVLTARPEERRLIFEEVAGISLYRMRKNEGLRKLAKTTENMERVQDLMAVLEESLTPMKAEADKAHVYNGLLSDKRRIAATMYLLKLTSTARMTARYENELETLREQDAEWEAKLAQAALSKEQLAKEVVDHQAALSKMGSALAAAQKKREDIRADYRVKEEMLRSLTEKEKELAEQEEDQTEAEAELKEDTEEAARELAAAREDLAQWTDKKKHAESEKEALSAKLAASEKAYAEKLSISQEKAKEKERLTAEVSHGEEEITRLRQEGDEAGKERQEAEAALASLKKDNARQQQERSQAEASLAEVEARGKQHSQALKDAQNRRFALMNEEGKIRSALSAAASKREYLERAEREYADFSRTTRVIMENRDRFGDGIHGVLGDILHVPDELTAAAEAALGSQISNIVVDSTATAQRLIGWLKEGHLGRTTFYPLESMHPRRLDDVMSAAREPGMLGLASRLFTCDAVYQDLADSLLGRTLIAQDLTAARRVAGKFHYRFRIVTVDGQLINAGGSMTGGSMRKSENTFFGRRKETARLRSEEAELRTRMTGAEKRRKETEAEADRLAETVSAEREEWQRRNSRLASLRASLDALQQSEKEAETRAGTLAKRQEEMRAALAAAEEKVESLKAQLAHYGDIPAPGQDETSEALRQALNRKQEELLAVHVSLTKAEEKVNFGLRMKKEREEAAAEQQKDRAVLEKDKADNRRGQQQSKAELEKLSTAFTEADKAYTAMEKEQAGLSDRSAVYAMKQKKTDEAWQAAQAKAAALKRDMAEREVRISHFKEEEEETKQRLAEEHLTVETAETLRLPGSMEDMKQKEAALTKQLAALGTVNPKAEEEYQAQLDKQTFYEDQLSDMREAEKGLQTVIHDMDSAMAEEFGTAFRKINEEFGRIMKLMFQGGSAKLELTDEKHPLESGIEMYLQLPGKKRQPLSLMSGGERALTVIALLISFMAYRPAPFCFVDEIDAALDDANVERYARMIRSYRDKTQFIVISHRKKTMEFADTLQGVTMAEKGVSSLITVRMKDYVE